MRPAPAFPGPDAAPAGLFDGGHLWIQEVVAGDLLRFRLGASGTIAFAGRHREYGSDPGAVPPASRLAVRRIRERFDRAALRGAVDDVASIEFVGVATCNRSVDYDWERTPAFLGLEVRDGDGDPLPPDAVEKIYEGVGLTPVPALEKEVRAVDFDLGDYEFPQSRYADAPVAGVVVRNKRGDRVVRPRDGCDLGIGLERDSDSDTARSPDGNPGDLTAEALVAEYVDDERLERIADDLERRGRSVTTGTLVDRTLEAVAREAGPGVVEADGAVEPSAFRSELGAVVGAVLDDRW